MSVCWLKRRPRGYSLVDVLIGMTILGIALSSAFALSITTSRLATLNQHVGEATALAESKLEEIRNTNYTAVVSGNDAGTLTSEGDAGGIFTRSWVVSDNLPQAGLKTVAVTVGWLQWGEARTYVLTGVIGP
jgi:type II secretory pathway pseudopilin PulG